MGEYIPRPASAGGPLKTTDALLDELGLLYSLVDPVFLAKARQLQQREDVAVVLEAADAHP